MMLLSLLNRLVGQPARGSPGAVPLTGTTLCPPSWGDQPAMVGLQGTANGETAQRLMLAYTSRHGIWKWKMRLAIVGLFDALWDIDLLCSVV